MDVCVVAKGSSQEEAIPYEELLYFTYKTHLETQSLLRQTDPPPPAYRLPIIILKTFQKQWNSDWKKITFTQRAHLFYKKMLFSIQERPFHDLLENHTGS